MLKKVLLAVAAIVLIVGGIWIAPQVMAAKGDKAAKNEAPAVVSDSDVAAVVNGSTIYRKDVLATIETLPFKGQVEPEKLYPMVVDQMINEKLIAAETDKAALASDPEVQKKLDEVRKQIIISVFLERKVGDLVTDEKLQAAYEDLKKESAGVEERHARHILVKSEDEAKAIIKALDAGGDFKALAKEKSTDGASADGGDLGYFTKEGMVPEFAAAAFDMNPGTYSKAPVKTQFGWHVIMLEDKRAKPAPEFDQVKSSLQKNLGQKAVGDFVQSLRQAAKIERFGMDGKPVN